MDKFDNYVAGKWTAGGNYSQNINPSDISDVVGEYAQAGDAQADAAIAAAAEAAPAWGQSGIQQRSDALDFIGNELLARKAELGKLLAREEGKTLPEGIGEVARAGQIFKYFAGETLRYGGEKLASVRPGVEVDMQRDAVGVIGIITPWNFPIAIPAWKIAPALAFGNTIVFKPAGLVPGSAWALSEIISRAGLPEGVFNMVIGSGGVVGQKILNDRRVHAVSFTGSVGTGSKVAAACSARGAKYQLEMGGKNPLIVLDDANLETALDCAVNGAFFSTGQRCTASSRLIVTDGIYQQFVEELTARTAALKVGHALAEGTQIGPVVDANQLQQDLSYVQIAKDEGATLACGGDRLTLENDGFYMAPALFTDTSAGMRINREEVFGPVASVLRVKDYEEAIAAANDTEFGLSAGICTSSLKYAHAFKRDAHAGMVMVNLPTAGVDYHVPFGGVKGSSYGSREQGSYAVEFYTRVKTSYLLA
ncbi:MAG: aldehyde dehydrogenase family protein [Kordiimonas sp.]